MPTVREIEEYLFHLAPQETAMDWDNVGCLVGNPEGEVRRVLTALDVTEDVAREAVEWECQLIAAHHPLMNCRWRPVQSVRADDFQGRLLTYLVKNDVSAICMHTNLDRAPGGVNDTLAAALRETAGLSGGEDLPGADGFCKMGTLPEPMPLEQFVRCVGEALGCSGLRYADGGRMVQRVATGGGACGEYVEAALRSGCDTFVTADIKYHGFLDAAAMGLNLIDAGHFPTENLVCGRLAAWLKEGFPELEVRVSERHRDVVRFWCP